MVGEKGASRAPLLQPAEVGWSGARRFTVVVSAVLACLFNSGLAFGFSALLPVLVDGGAFHDACPPGTPDGRACGRQMSALTGMFTLATSMLNAMALPSGAVLDHLGPRATAACLALVTASGCLLFAHGGPGTLGHLAFYGGFLLLAVAGPAMFNCTLSFSNFFPRRKGVICAALVGCFDASSAVFVGLGAVINSGVTFEATFEGYAVIPTLFAAIAFMLWPSSPVSAPSEPAPEGLDGAKPAGSGALDLQHLGVRQQILSPEFGLLTHTVCVTMVCINFFIATVFAQMAEVDPGAALPLTRAFAAMLPLGGIVYTPLIGPMVDAIGPTRGFAVLWVLYVLFQILLGTYSATGAPGAAYGAFAVFAFCRPLFYTLGAAFTGQVFGFATFGKVYGLVTTIAGLANLLVQPLEMLAHTQGFRAVNGVILAAFVTTGALPAVVLLRRRPSLSRKQSVDVCGAEVSVGARVRSISGEGIF